MKLVRQLHCFHFEWKTIQISTCIQAIELAGRGAEVILACRNLQDAKNAAWEINKTTFNTKVHVEQLDLADMTSIRHFARRFNDTYGTLDILVNNAGCDSLQFKDQGRKK